ncbi:MAG: cupin domain-containing protein [Pseudomonadota bacterium]
MPVKVIDIGHDPDTRTYRRLADLPDRVIEGDPHHESTLNFQSPDGRLIAGTWTSTPGRWHAFTDRDEFCYILEGHVRLIAEDGSAQTYRTGDAFLIPDGFRGDWEVIETTTKNFVIRHQDRD